MFFKSLGNYWRSLTPLTQNVFIFIFVNTIVINILLMVLFSVPWDETVLSHVFDKFLLVKQKRDSWDTMNQAFSYIQAEHKTPLYTEVFFNRRIKFQYPPTSLLILSFLKIKLIDNLLKTIGLSWLDIVKGLSWISVIVTAVFSLKIFQLSLERNTSEINHSSKSNSITINTLIFALSLTFYPVIKAYSLGQIQALINALFAVFIWCWMKDKKSISGILMGVMCLIKPQYWIIFLWGLLRRQWTFALTFVVTALAGLLVSISLFGIADHFNYLNALSFMSRHGETFYPNQSVNGLLNRLLFNGNNLEWQKDAFSPFNAWVYIGTTISSTILISVALFWPTRPWKKGSVTDLSIAALTCTIASPIAWEHHYGILLPIYAFLLPCLLKQQVLGKMTIPYLGISYVLSSNYFDVTKKLAYAPFNLNIIQSYLLAGGLMVLVCLYVLRLRQVRALRAGSGEWGVGNPTKKFGA